MNKKILAIETTTNICSVSLYIENELVSIRENDNREHSTFLGKFIDEIFKSQKIRLSDIDAIALSIGPGSYTGLRIGLSMAKGLAYSLEKPIIPINTIESINHLVNDENYFIVVPAYKDFYFIQEYKKSNKINDIQFNTIDSISIKKTIYGYSINKDDLKINTILPCSKNIAEVAYKNFDKYICYDIKKIKPNYVKPIKYKEITIKD